MKRTSFSTLLCIALLVFSVSCGKDNGTQSDNKESYPHPVEVSPKSWDGTKRGNITYQLLVYSFADSNGDGVGDFQGIIDKIDYIDAMGASAIWLSPIHPAMSYHGYDVLDYAAINPDYGTEADFDRLVAAAHSKGIKVYLDYVLNHTGRDHEWFKSASASSSSPYRDYYIFSTDPQADIAAGRIAQIATEGAAGYDSGQWFAVPASSSGESQQLKFVLDWSNASAPKVTVSRTESITNSGSPTSGRYLYFGDGECREFYTTAANTYSLSLDFASSWGFLIRTSNTSWSAGTKYGAQSATANTITYGVPFTLASNSSSDPADIKLPGMATEMFHSHFWTNWFADLNYGAAATAEQSGAFKAVCAAADHWIEHGIDGLRLDAVKHIYHNAVSNENPTFLRKFYDRMNTTFRATHSTDIYMVGEMYSEHDQVAPYYAGLPALFEFSFWNRLSWALNNSTGCYFAKDITSYLPEYEAVRSDYIEATKLSNHDEDRTRSTLDGSLDRAMAAAAVLLTSGGSPYIYYGEELGLKGTKSSGDEYVRQPMLWGDSYVTSYTTKIDKTLNSDVQSVAAQSADSDSILNLYRRFGQLRNSYPSLATGTMSVYPPMNENQSYKSVAAWYRTAQNERVLVLHNLSSASVTFDVDDKIDSAIGVNGDVTIAKLTETSKVTMKGWSSVIFLLQ